MYNREPVNRGDLTKRSGKGLTFNGQVFYLGDGGEAKLIAANILLHILMLKPKLSVATVLKYNYFDSLVAKL